MFLVGAATTSAIDDVDDDDDEYDDEDFDTVYSSMNKFKCTIGLCFKCCILFAVAKTCGAI